MTTIAPMKGRTGIIFHGIMGTTCSREGDEYVMRSPKTGEHRLYVPVTDSIRLMAHWRGFQQNQYR